ncbi:MAG: hypothetical protein J0H64_03140, partial [Actinobacteria bacterium]|nr:hypothetical protein [Actinomycetota bacterium]
MVALAVSVIIAVLDVTRTVAASRIVTTPLKTSWNAVSPDTLGAAESFVRERMPPLHERMLDAIPLRGGRPLREIARRAGVSEIDARGALAELEILGRVRNDDSPGGEESRWSLVRGE